ncbi:MAG TPA: alpha/beta hydrolase [Candidatus Dormibacteraeota bacterium]|nr:alpha/beta hydrolase [Candidatus Dormibacteraeota bacterium]
MQANKHTPQSSPELRLGKGHSTDYGRRYEGVIAVEDREVPVTWREAPKDRQSGKAYALATGWLGRKSSMRKVAHAAARAGHSSLAFDYTNTGTEGALRRNAADFAAAITALPTDRRYAIALSMSGGIMPDALVQAPVKVEAATAVAAFGYIPGRHSLGEAIQHLGATAPELVTLGWKAPATAARLGAVTFLHSFGRGPAIGAEFEEMREGIEPTNLHAVTSSPDSPVMRFLYGSSDRLFPAAAQAEAGNRLPFHHVAMYQGGHLALVHDVGLSEHIFELDSREPVPEEPWAIAA